MWEKTSCTIEKLPSFPKRKFSKALEEKVWCFSLFLFGVGLLTDNVIQPAHSHWVRPESFPSFLMAGIFSWHVNQTYKSLKALFQPTGRHHYYFVQINVLVLWKIHPLFKCILCLNNYFESCQTVFQNVTRLSFWGLWLSHTTSLKNSAYSTDTEASWKSHRNVSCCFKLASK